MLAEAIFHVRTAVMLSISGGPPGTIIITSPNPNEGKTTISANLAAALATTGKKVVLMDADLRKPRVHSIFQLPAQPGLSNFLTRNATLTEILHPTPIPGLFIIPAGTVPPNPVQLLTSEMFMEFMKDLERCYHHVLVDTPPVIGFAEARAISSLAEGVLLVARHHATSREALRLAVQLLTQVKAPILGAVLNMAQSDRMGYGGYYGYYKYYSHYYKQYDEVKEIRVKE
jgi:capsular exopolysaccharide synthesis family protein